MRQIPGGVVGVALMAAVEADLVAEVVGGVAMQGIARAVFVDQALYVY
jgi:hypothetical protein